MKRQDVIHRGWIDAIAFVFGPETMSERDAHKRVLALFQSGSRLLLMPDQRWLLVLAQPVRVQAEHAPGTPFCLDGSVWSAGPDLDLNIRADTPTLQWMRHGVVHHALLSDLVELDPSMWISLGVPVLDGTALSPTPTPTVRIVAEAPPVDLREKAGVKPLSAKAQQAMREMAESEARRRASQAASTRRRANAGAARANPKSVFTSNTPAIMWLLSAIAKLALLTPLSRSISRKHEKYLDDLKEQFANGNFAEALRNAIPFGGEGSGTSALTRIGLPGSRQSLAFTGRGSSGGVVPYGAEVTAMLSTMYRNAASQLEADSRFHEAAYVLAELMNKPGEAISMLERNKEWRIGVDVANAFKLDPDVRVRLLWLAGEQQQAVAVARRHGNYHAVIAKLKAVNPQAAFDLRVRWVNDLESAGDNASAVEIGWEEPELRPLLINTVQKAKQAGGPAVLSMYAYERAIQPTEENREALAKQLQLEKEQPGAGFARFVETLDRIGPVPDAAADRQLTASTLRHMMTTHTNANYPPATYRAIANIRKRADPLLAADLASLYKPPTNPANPTSALSLPSIARGTQPVFDAARVIDGSLLVAVGEMGVQLINENGGVVARWSVPTHAIVMSDTGAKALLITRRQSVIDVHTLDLASRKTERYGTLQTPQWADSYDGATWVVALQSGYGNTLAFFDMFEREPTVAWQELTDGERLLFFDRTAEWLCAAVEISVPPPAPSPSVLQLWHWKLPTMHLDRKYPMHDSVGKILRSKFGSIVGVDPAKPSMRMTDSNDHWISVPSMNEMKPWQIENVIAFSRSHSLHRTLDNPSDFSIKHDTFMGNPIAAGQLGGSNWNMRSTAGTIVLWDSEGRVCVVDTSEGTVRSHLIGS